MEKRTFLLYLGGKNSNFKKGGGGDINYFDNIHPFARELFLEDPVVDDIFSKQ